MHKAIAAIILVAAAGSAGCARDRSEAPGPIVERNFAVGAFDSIEMAGAYDVTVRTGAAPSVHAKGGEKMLERLVVEVEGNRLKIHPRERRGFNWGGWGKHGKVALTITVPSLRSAELAGSGGVRIDKVTGDSFNGAIAGSGELRIDSVEVGLLKLGIAGSGGATAGAGRAKSVEFDIAGSGDIDAKGVAAESANVSIAGSGNIAANAARDAKVSIMGSGDVEITGGARCTIQRGGSGNVRCS